MSHYDPNLYAAIVFRLKSDTGTGGLFNVSSPLVNGAYLEQEPTEANLPQITINEAYSMNADAVRNRGQKVGFEVHIWTARNPISVGSGSEPRDPIYDAFQRASDIEKRVLGDWTAQAAGSGPTYGLDRYQLSLDNYTSGVTACGWTADTIRRSYGRKDDNDDILHRILGFDVLLSEAAV